MDKNILILGIGNILMGDEGIGVRVAQYLLSRPLPEHIFCLDGGTGGFHLLEYLQNAGTVFLIDAINDGKRPGTITLLTPRYSGDYPPGLSAHDIGLKDLIDALYLLNTVPRINLYAISIRLLPEPTMNLSNQLEEAVVPIAKRVLNDALLMT